MDIVNYIHWATLVIGMLVIAFALYAGKLSSTRATLMIALVAAFGLSWTIAIYDITASFLEYVLCR